MQYEIEKYVDPYKEDCAQEECDKVFQGNLPLKAASKIVQDIFAEYSDDQEDVEEMSRRLEEFIDKILSQDDVSGTADDWHNLAVDIARKDYFGLACKVLDAGLERFQRNTDLIGDYLQYGVSCGQIEQCSHYYELLAQMPKIKYTWRSFHFSIDWLIYLWDISDDQTTKQLNKEMMDLVLAYRKYFPKSEDSYICEANVYKLLKEVAAEEKVLLKAVKQPFPSPKCALRLADMYFNEGKYEKALNMVLQSIDDSNQTQPTVNEAYLYYLSGLARISLRKKDASIDLNMIYNDFENCLQLGVGRSFRATICRKAALLSRESDIAILENYSRLYNLLADHEML